jgi:hypothetical protein
VPGGLVNAVGGNLLVRRVDLSIDTWLGTREIGAVYNSALGFWLWDFEMRYDGASFLDPTGAVHETWSLAPGSAIPGTVWVVVDADSVRTKGGLVHDFDGSGRLAAIHWRSAAYPRLAATSQTIAGAAHHEDPPVIAAGSCSDVRRRLTAGRVVAITDRAGAPRASPDAGGRLTARPRHGPGLAGLPLRAPTELTSLTNLGDASSSSMGGRNTRVRAVGEATSVPVRLRGRQAACTGRGRSLAGEIRSATTPTGGSSRWRTWPPASSPNAMWKFQPSVASEIRPDGAAPRGPTEDDVATKLEPSGNVVRYVIPRMASIAMRRRAADRHGERFLASSSTWLRRQPPVSVTNGAGETLGPATGPTTRGDRDDRGRRPPLPRPRRTRARGAHPPGRDGAARAFDHGNLLEGPSDDFEPAGRPRRAHVRRGPNLAGVLLADMNAYGRATTTSWITVEHRRTGVDGDPPARRRRPRVCPRRLGRLVESASGWTLPGARPTSGRGGRPTAIERPNGMRETAGTPQRIATGVRCATASSEGTLELAGRPAGSSRSRTLAGGSETTSTILAGVLRHPRRRAALFGWARRARRARST